MDDTGSRHPVSLRISGKGAGRMVGRGEGGVGSKADFFQLPKPFLLELWDRAEGGGRQDSGKHQIRFLLLVAKGILAEGFVHRQPRPWEIKKQS